MLDLPEIVFARTALYEMMFFTSLPNLVEITQTIA